MAGADINSIHFRTIRSGYIACEKHVSTVIGTKVMTAREKFDFIKASPTGSSVICVRCSQINQALNDAARAAANDRDARNDQKLIEEQN